MKNKDIAATAADRSRTRRAMDILASTGMLLIAVGLVAPFAGLLSSAWLTAFKWIYTVGAAAYFIARFTASLGRDQSMRIRRLRRMESWAGIAFLAGAFFWFYNTRITNEISFLGFRFLGETIAFTMAGAVIQLVATWRISSAQKKEESEKEELKKGK